MFKKIIFNNNLSALNCSAKRLHNPSCNMNKLELNNKLDTDIDYKSYDEIPGPSKWKFPLQFIPGGELHNANLVELHKYMRRTYGDISKVKGIFGQLDTVFTFNAEDFEKVYRTEGVWPLRIGLNTFTYYRKKLRPDIFQNVGGLVSEQGQLWGDIRAKVNPILMKPEIAKTNLPNVDKISTEFINRLTTLIDPTTNELHANNSFLNELKKWSFESISVIALNKHLGMLTSNPDLDAIRLNQAMNDFFTLSFEFDVVPSFWKYYETERFKKLITTYDTITEITIKFIDEAISNFHDKLNSEAVSVLEKLCKIDKKVAIVMAMDMLMAGADTTSSAFTTILYLLATNPKKQAKLREELMEILPEKDTPLTSANTKNMPYLRACIKEGLRITPITPGNLRMAGQDLVLSGYQVPKGTGVLMGVMELANEEKYFPQSSTYLPERWLKSRPDACPHAKASNPFVYLPFGFGPRTCIGKRIAELEIECLLAKIVRNFKVTWTSESELSYISNLILVPHGDIKFNFEPI